MTWPCEGIRYPCCCNQGCPGWRRNGASWHIRIIKIQATRINACADAGYPDSEWRKIQTRHQIGGDSVRHPDPPTQRSGTPTVHSRKVLRLGLVHFGAKGRRRASVWIPVRRPWAPDRMQFEWAPVGYMQSSQGKA